MLDMEAIYQSDHRQSDRERMKYGNIEKNGNMDHGQKEEEKRK